MNMRKLMTMSGEEKVVQTTLSREEYERLRRLAEIEGESLKETLRAAATAYVREQSSPDPDDPFFAYEADGTTGEELSAADVDEYLYGEE